jgi:hypothetical protein
MFECKSIIDSNSYINNNLTFLISNSYNPFEKVNTFGLHVLHISLNHRY